MKFSIFQLPTSFTPEHDAPSIGRQVDQALWADEAGFAGVFQAEHHASGLCPTGADSIAFAFTAFA